MKDETVQPEAGGLHCAICGRELGAGDLRELAGGGLLLCGWCRAEQESCGCGDGD